MGFERAGLKCVAQVEIDKKARGVLARHFPDVPRFEDVKKVGRENLPSARIIVGGFPCQDVSVAGRRKGLAGKRSGLWFEFARIVEECAPRWVVVENVPGLLSSNKGKDFEVIITSLVKYGYGVCWRVFDSQYFGVAQRRARLFIVGSLGDGRAAEILFEREGMRRNIKAKRAAGETDPTLFASGAGTSRVASAGSESEFLIVAPPLGGHHYRTDLDNEAYVVANSLTTKEDRRSSPDNETLLVASPLTISLGHHGWSVGDQDIDNLIAFDWQSGGDVRLNISAEATSALQANQTPAVLQGGVRRLTPVECQRLQGFPDGYTDGQPDAPRYMQCGNAVTVNVAEWLGRRIKDNEQRTNRD